MWVWGCAVYLLGLLLDGPNSPTGEREIIHPPQYHVFEIDPRVQAVRPRAKGLLQAHRKL